MPRHAALPFLARRSRDVLSGGGYTSTKEVLHGLLILGEDDLVVQWRVARKTEYFGSEIRSDEEMDPVQEVVIPLDGVAGAGVRSGWRTWFVGSRLVLTASDLRAFEAVVVAEGPPLGHPGELVLPVRRRDLLAAREFAAELALTLAERSGRGNPRLTDRSAGSLPGGSQPVDPP